MARIALSCFIAFAVGMFAHQASSAEQIVDSIGMKLVLVPSGDFMMGAEEDPADSLPPNVRRDLLDHELPRHRVRVTRPFYMGAYEVTLRQFLVFYHAAKYKTDAERDGKPNWGYNRDGDNIKSTTFRPWAPGWKIAQDHPAVYVSWNDAVAFCNWLSKKEGKKYRLPTEAEWEYACRAGTETRYSCGDDAEELVRVGNVADEDNRRHWPKSITIIENNNKKQTNIPFPALPGRDGYGYTAPVGKFRANAFGLYDMHGNAWEWCSDRYDEHYYENSPTDDPKGPSAGTLRVLRGGGWNDSSPAGLRCAFRGSNDPVDRDRGIGFRVVCEQ
ncbi:MAG TPA: formylglycine-generating enzyme family protein [Pirellulales bacterium]|nr:formylglycine-generating enzyme family protein [Pirellulales bacterium]